MSVYLPVVLFDRQARQARVSAIYHCYRHGLAGARLMRSLVKFPCQTNETRGA